MSSKVLPGKMPALFWAVDAWVVLGCRCMPTVAPACVFTSLHPYPLSLCTDARSDVLGLAAGVVNTTSDHMQSAATENTSGRRQFAPSYLWSCARTAWVARVCVHVHRADRPCL